MKIGIVLGGFVPLHQGHLSIIYKAKKENEKVFVIVCGYDGDPRAEEIGLPLEKRTRLIKDFFKDDEIVEVIKCDDTELGLDESMSDSNWKIWLNYNYKQIETKFPLTNEYTWYVGEPSYKETLNKFTKDSVVLVDRKDIPCSGTECRKNPIKNWKYISSVFRPYMSHNILIAGTASEGKTTLIEDVGKMFNIVYSYEKGRDNYGVCSKTDEDFDFEDFMYNLYEQHKYNKSLIHSSQNTGIFISDSDNLVTLMYAKLYSEREEFALKKEQYEILKSVALQYRPATKWNKIFLIKPSEKPIVDDGERYMKDSDYSIRLEYYNILKELMDEFGYKYEEVEGGFAIMFETLKSYIKKYCQYLKKVI